MMPVRVLTFPEVGTLINWAKAEGWNPGLDDARAFFAADPDGFLGAFDDTGNLAAGISLVRYGAAFAFLGLYICRPDLRAKGYGWQVWQAAISHAAGRPIGLDGVVAQQENYRKSGFAYSYANIRYSGPAPSLDPPSGLSPLTPADFDSLADLDRACFGTSRPAFLKHWLTYKTLALQDATGRVIAYGTRRPCETGHKIAPLFAPDAATARVLIAGLTADIPGETLILDCPATNPAAVALATSLGLTPGFETARMWLGPAPAVDLAKVFAVTSFELG